MTTPLLYAMMILAGMIALTILDDY